MKFKITLIRTFAWSQLVVSVALGSAIIFAYINYQSTVGQFVHSVAASIGAVSNVVTRTAETVEARRDLIDETGRMLVVTKNLINEMRLTTGNLEKTAPAYSATLLSTSKLIDDMGRIAHSLGAAMNFQVPTGIQREGIKPVFKWSTPLAKQAEALQDSALHMKQISEGISQAAIAVGRDAKSLGAAINETSAQALKVTTELENTLGRLKTQDLPKALADLKTTSEKLQSISKRVDLVGNIGEVLLVIGLLLSLWCFLNSLSTIALTRSANFKFDRQTSISDKAN